MSEWEMFWKNKRRSLVIDVCTVRMAFFGFIDFDFDVMAQSEW